MYVQLQEKRCEQLLETIVGQLEAGQSVNHRRKFYRKLEKKITNIKKEFKTGLRNYRDEEKLHTIIFKSHVHSTK